MIHIGHEPWPKPRPELVRRAQQLAVGPIGPNALVLDWHATNLPEEFAQNHFGGHEPDSGASLLPRRWRPLGGYAVSRRWIEDGRAGRLVGIGYLSAAGRTVVGALLEGQELGVHTTDPTKLVFIGRVVNGPLLMGPVLIEPESSQIIAAPASLIEAVRMPDTGILPEFARAPIV